MARSSFRRSRRSLPTPAGSCLLLPSTFCVLVLGCLTPCTCHTSFCALAVGHSAPFAYSRLRVLVLGHSSPLNSPCLCPCLRCVILLCLCFCVLPCCLTFAACTCLFSCLGVLPHCVFECPLVLSLTVFVFRAWLLRPNACFLPTLLPHNVK